MMGAGEMNISAGWGGGREGGQGKVETVFRGRTREVHSRCCSRRNDNLNVNTQLEKKKLFKPSQQGRKLISFWFFFFGFFFTKQNPGQGARQCRI